MGTCLEQYVETFGNDVENMDKFGKYLEHVENMWTKKLQSLWNICGKWDMY